MQAITTPKLSDADIQRWANQDQIVILHSLE